MNAAREVTATEGPERESEGARGEESDNSIPGLETPSNSVSDIANSD